MKIKNSEIVFLVRSYNEATRIVDVLSGILGAWFSEILVIDDGSTDDTATLLETHFSQKIHTVRHPMNRGWGAALETGFEYIRRFGKVAGWEYVVTFDADGQHDIANISRFIQAFEQDPTLDIVFWSRFIEKTDSNVPFIRRLILWGGKIFTSLISRMHLTDAHNGYRMMRRSVLDSLHLTMDGMEYASELIDQISTHGFHWCEVPVDIHYDTYTLKKWQRYGGPLRIAMRMIRKKFF